MQQKKQRENLLQIIESIVANLQLNENKINNLNVFPVPDGDTGSNMLATLTSAWNNISHDLETPIEILNALSKGALLGARGNSGVITSQIIKGFTEGVIKNKGIYHNLKATKIVLSEMRNYAYNSVSDPVEGTILSVIRELDEKYNTENSSSIDLWKSLHKIAKDAVLNTPNQLEVLKEAGVVDSGAYGLMIIFEGIVAALNDEPFIIKISENKNHKPEIETNFIKADPTNNIGYCTEFILTLRNPKSFKQDKFKAFLNKIGDSLVMIVEGDILKVHIHVKTPGNVFNEAQKHGEFTNIKVDNMATQTMQNGHEVIANSFIISKQNIQEDLLAIIAVSNGKGIDNYFQELGVSELISGGQSMNPSVQDFISTIDKLQNKKILLLPNNSNIILTAETVKKQITNKEIFVLPTKSIQQGITALLNISNEMTDFDTFRPGIIEAINEIDEAVVTYAVRNTIINKIIVTKGDFIAIGNKNTGLLSVDKDLMETTKQAITKIISQDNEVLTIIYNRDVTSQNRKDLSKWMKKSFSDVEFVIKYGGQKVYCFLIFGEK